MARHITDPLTGKRRLPRRAVADRYGRSIKTLSRWEDDPAMEFPKSIDINGFKYFAEADLIDWENRRSTPTPRIVAAQAARAARLAQIATDKASEKRAADIISDPDETSERQLNQM
jgi:hypothetical protein